MTNKVLKVYLIILLCYSQSLLFGQQTYTDTVSIVSYNTLNYGFPATTSCPNLQTWTKHRQLKNVLRYTHPDILGLVKMNASPTTFATDSIMRLVLDSVCLGCYGRSIYTNYSGYTKVNMLYYNQQKFGFVSTTPIATSDPNISDISLHRLYYKDRYLGQNPDTVFLNIILVHLKSGSSSASSRGTEIVEALTWLNNHVNTPGNYIFMGDFNSESSSEPCIQSLIVNNNVNTRFYDPVNQLGNWSSNPIGFANYLTQSTRLVDPGDCGAVGGMDSRFDHILCSQPVMLGTRNMLYLNNTFKVVGQDGLHTNLALTDAPANTSVPRSLLQDLYGMSNHLPVTARFQITRPVPVGVGQISTNTSLGKLESLGVTGQFRLEVHTDQPEDMRLTIYDITGRVIDTRSVYTQAGTNFYDFDASVYPTGIYLLQAETQSGRQVWKFIK